MADYDRSDKLDRILRDDARHAIPDGGFSARVMSALPPRTPRPRPWLGAALVMGSALLGSALAVLLAPAGAATQGFVDLAQLRGLTLPAITGLAMCGALLVSAIVLAADTD